MVGRGERVGGRGTVRAENDGGCVALFVRKAAGDDLDALLLRERRRRTAELDLAPSAVLPDDLDVPPLGTPVRGTEHLQRGFLRGEAGGEAISTSVRTRGAIGDLGVRVHALQIAVAEPLDGCLDTADVDDVRSETEGWVGHGRRERRKASSARAAEMGQFHADLCLPPYL